MGLSFGSRKVQLIHGTAFVSLPQTWVRNYSIQKGDELHIRLKDNGSLEISYSKAEIGGNH